ncbi:MAG TPA: serine/threonine-protein kinase [Gemmatimonadaceae bacterium]|nr:serine/threonine-protein kinase [Gemmatimonadaceae bacterium]
MTDHLLDRLVAAVGTQYLVDAEIGRGGMAVVYRATDLRLHRRVAIKLLPPELAFNADVRERFLREAQMSAQLAHPNIVPIYTVDEREGMVYFVMALVDGESLAERLKREMRVPIPDARRILADVADALAYAHERGVVHRDVKPDNVMLDRATGRAVVTDFGIARAAAGDSRLTVTGVAVGTPAYMSPEQALGERELDGRSDIYSLGVVAYQMLAGETPFKASNTPAMLVKHLSETPRPLDVIRPDAPTPLVHAIMRALAKKPENRWSDAAAFRAAILEQRDVSAHAEPAPRPSRAPEPQPAAQLPAAPAHYESPFADRDRPSTPANEMPHDLGIPAMPPLPPLPTFGSRQEWKQWRQMQRNWDEERRRREKLALKLRHGSPQHDATRPIEERIASWRNKAMGGMSTVAVLGVINALTSFGHWWFVFPGAFITLGVVSKGGRLWADGVPVSRLLSRGTLPAEDAPAAQGRDVHVEANRLALRLAPSHVLAGPHGEAVRRAASDRSVVEDTITRLSKSEREMIPDVVPTVVALSERVGSLAVTLHGLDVDVSVTSVSSLDQRVAALRTEAGVDPTPEQERRIALLERQRTTITELVERRRVLAGQLESALLALQNLRLDLLKLRSSGLESAMSDVTSATQEARAISRDIGHAVDAVGEVRRL